jgi:hypothetical protein
MKAIISGLKRSTGTLAMALFIATAALPYAASAQQLRNDQDIAPIVVIEQLAIKDGRVSGAVRNKTSHMLRDVQLFIRYTWLWDDERNPGKIDPGTSTFHTLTETIQPGAKLDFTYQPSPPLPRIAGGHFETSVKIAGFTEVIPQR